MGFHPRMLFNIDDEEDHSKSVNARVYDRKEKEIIIVKKDKMELIDLYIYKDHKCNEVK